MILYPAIDLLGGKAVRLRKGKRDDVTVYGDPVDIAKSLRDQGAEWLHLVDLEAAFDGETKALPLIEEIVKAFGGPVELGGGIRSLDAIRQRMEAGVTCCILGTVAYEQPELVSEACKMWPCRIAAGIDAKNGLVALRGWVETAEMTAIDLALKMKAMEFCLKRDVSTLDELGGTNADVRLRFAAARCGDTSVIERLAVGDPDEKTDEPENQRACRADNDRNQNFLQWHRKDSHLLFFFIQFLRFNG